MDVNDSHSMRMDVDCKKPHPIVHTSELSTHSNGHTSTLNLSYQVSWLVNFKHNVVHICSLLFVILFPHRLFYKTTTMELPSLRIIMKHQYMLSSVSKSPLIRTCTPSLPCLIHNAVESRLCHLVLRQLALRRLEELMALMPLLPKGRGPPVAIRMVSVTLQIT